jgi:hypothetical protein
MKKSLSCPSLNTYPNLNTIASSSPKRNVSCDALAVSAYTIATLQNELEFASTKIPLNKLISCGLNQVVTSKFPENIIITEDDIKDFGVCISEPNDQKVEETSELSRNVTRCYWFDRVLDNKATIERYNNMYSKIRKRNKK